MMEEGGADKVKEMLKMTHFTKGSFFGDIIEIFQNQLNIFFSQNIDKNSILCFGHMDIFRYRATDTICIQCILFSEDKE